MNRFLVDQNVNQKAIRKINRSGKGFDILLPQDGTFEKAVDAAVVKFARAEARTIVTCDKDFTRLNLRLHDVPAGAIVLRPLRIGQKRVGELISRLCQFLLTNFPQDPYNFHGKIVEVHEDRVDILDSKGSATHTF